MASPSSRRGPLTSAKSPSLPKKPTPPKPPKQQAALHELAPRALSDVLPLKEALIPSDLVPFPARAVERLIGKAKVPCIALLPVSYTLKGDPPAAGAEENLRALGRGLDGLLRRDILHAEGLSVLDFDHTPKDEIG